jgi:hypothetical protein
MSHWQILSALSRIYEDPHEWTAITGPCGNHSPALIRDNGIIEPTMTGGSIVPFLSTRVATEHSFISPASFPSAEHTLRNGHLPIPSVYLHGHRSGISLRVTAFTYQVPDQHPFLFVRYEVINESSDRCTATLKLVHANYKVSPPAQNSDDPRRAQAAKIRFDDLYEKIRNMRYH